MVGIWTTRAREVNNVKTNTFGEMIVEAGNVLLFSGDKVESIVLIISVTSPVHLGQYKYVLGLSPCFKSVNQERVTGQNFSQAVLTFPNHLPNTIFLKFNIFHPSNQFSMCKCFDLCWSFCTQSSKLAKLLQKTSFIIRFGGQGLSSQRLIIC